MIRPARLILATITATATGLPSFYLDNRDTGST
jgi:hypothetical protein